MPGVHKNVSFNCRANRKGRNEWRTGWFHKHGFLVTELPSGAEQQEPWPGDGRRGSGCSVWEGQAERSHNSPQSVCGQPGPLSVCQWLCVSPSLGPLSHTVAGDKINSWNVRIKAIQRRPRALNREVLPWNKALFYLKSLTHTIETASFFFNSSLASLSLSSSLRSSRCKRCMEHVKASLVRLWNPGVVSIPLPLPSLPSLRWGQSKSC